MYTQDSGVKIMQKLVNGVLTPLTAEEIAEVEATRAKIPSETERKWTPIRAERNIKLQQTDWIVARASETGVAVTDEWKTYRQALRDITAQSDPDNVTWPTEPS